METYDLARTENAANKIQNIESDIHAMEEIRESCVQRADYQINEIQIADNHGRIYCLDVRKLGCGFDDDLLDLLIRAKKVTLHEMGVEI